MGTAVALAVYGVALALLGAAVWRRPLLALYVFLVGLAVHNAVMAALYEAGLRDGALTLVQGWKEALLAVALGRVAWDSGRARRLPFRPGAVDLLALLFAALVVVYWLLPQGPLGGDAGTKAELLALRHDLAPVAAFLLGRALVLGRDDLRRLGWTLVGAATAVAAVGLVEVYAVPIEVWRDSSVPAYFRDQLGYDYHGTGGLPENFVYNTGSEDHFLRRLVSVFLSPLGTAFMLVVALLVAAAGGPLRRRPRLLAGLVALAFVGLLFTFTRSALVALAAGLCALAFALRKRWPVAAAVAVLAVGVGFAAVFPSIAPRGDWTQADLRFQRQQAEQRGGVEGGPLSTDEPSVESHLTSLREGLRTVLEHPQGYGLGNAGTVASRSDVEVRAGESNYTEIGVETGLAGMLLFAGWNLALLAGLLRAARREADWASAAVAASLAAVLALAVQTDTLGVPWLAYCVWWLGGSLLTAAPLRAPLRDRATRQPTKPRVAPPQAEARP